MLEINNLDQKIKIELKNKMSINSALDLVELSINGKVLDKKELEFSFNSFDISDEDDQLFTGEFKVSEGISISDRDALELQKLYLAWEAEKLDRKHVTYMLPSGKDDNKSNGVAMYNPYFLAVANKYSRERDFDLLGFGLYLRENEYKFLHQYCAFHPAIRKFITLKDESSTNERTVIQCNIFELVVANGLAHIEGYRDHIRFKSIFESKGIEAYDDGLDDDCDENDENYICEMKFLMEYDHVLDSKSIWSESLDFYSGRSSGGQLDLLNI